MIIYYFSDLIYVRYRKFKKNVTVENRNLVGVE